MLFLAILLLLAAIGLLVAAIYTGQTVLAWGSVGLSALVVLALLLLLRRARRRHREAADTDPDAQDEELDDGPDAVEDDRDDDKDKVAQADVSADGTSSDEASTDGAARRDDAAPGDDEAEDPSVEKPQVPEVAEAGDVDAEAGDVEDGDSKPDETRSAETRSAETKPGDTDADEDEIEPDEEDTDAADLLVVWELSDEVLVVDEHPRYHLARCSWPDAATAEPLPVKEARELGFTPCAQCRPDATLARKRRAALAKQNTTKQDPVKQDTEDTGTGREASQEADQGARSGG